LLRPQFGDEPQNLLEKLSRDGDLGHLIFAPVLIILSFKLVSDQSLIAGNC